VSWPHSISRQHFFVAGSPKLAPPFSAAMSRRGKFAAGPTPYKVHFTNTEAGKTIAGLVLSYFSLFPLMFCCPGTKRRVVWRFGWSDSEREHEVGLIHSVLSGKKVWDPDFISCLTNLRRPFWKTGERSLLLTQFSLQISATDGSPMVNDCCPLLTIPPIPGHLYRIEADTSNATDPVYTFTIDGVPFHDFQNKPTRFDPVETSFSKKADAPKPVEKKPTVAVTPKEERRPSQVSTFDPFSDSSSNTKSADAFADFGGSSNSKPAPAAPAAKPAEFDFFGSSEAPAPVAKSAHVDDFFSTPAPAPTSKPSTSNDLFSDFADLTFTPTSTVMASNSSLVDPFAPAPAPAPVNPYGVNLAASNPPPEPERKDNLKKEWSGLVDLDLKGNKTGGPSRPSTTQQSGPSLSMLSSNSAPSSSTGPAMVSRSSNAGFGAPSGFGGQAQGPSGGWGAPQPPAPAFGGSNMGADPFGNFGSQPPRQSGGAFPGGNMGMGGPGMGMGGPGMGMGGPGMGSMGSSGFSSFPSMGPGGGPGMPPQGNASFGRPPASNSLDSLNWKM
jgi:hypothetical protein